LRTGSWTTYPLCPTRPRKNWEESFRCTINDGPMACVRA
jgi:hypothetical protein